MTRYSIIVVTIGLLIASAQAQQEVVDRMSWLPGAPPPGASIELKVVAIRGQRFIVTNVVPRFPGCEGSKHLYELTYDNVVGAQPAGATFEVKLLTIIDSGRNKPGKKVTAVVSDNGALVEGTPVRHNTKIVGHIAEVQKLDK